MTRPFHLAWFLQGSSVQAWGENWTGHIGESWMQPELFLDMARSLERACFDYILLEDSSEQAALQTALDAVARRNHLTRGSLSKSSNAIRFDYSRGDQRTHAIHLLAPPAAATPAPNASRYASPLTRYLYIIYL